MKDTKKQLQTAEAALKAAEAEHEAAALEYSAVCEQIAETKKTQQEAKRHFDRAKTAVAVLDLEDRKIDARRKMFLTSAKLQDARDDYMQIRGQAAVDEYRELAPKINDLSSRIVNAIAELSAANVEFKQTYQNFLGKISPMHAVNLNTPSVEHLFIPNVEEITRFLVSITSNLQMQNRASFKVIDQKIEESLNKILEEVRK